MNQDRFDELAKAAATNDLSQLQFGRSRFLRLMGLGLLGALRLLSSPPEKARLSRPRLQSPAEKPRLSRPRLQPLPATALLSALRVVAVPNLTPLLPWVPVIPKEVTWGIAGTAKPPVLMNVQTYGCAAITS